MTGMPISSIQEKLGDIFITRAMPSISIDRADGVRLYNNNKTEEFDGYEQSYRLIFKWHALDKINELDLYPVFLKKKLVDISDGIEHFVERDA